MMVLNVTVEERAPAVPAAPADAIVDIVWTVSAGPVGERCGVISARRHLALAETTRVVSEVVRQLLAARLLGTRGSR